MRFMSKCAKSKIRRRASKSFLVRPFSGACCGGFWRAPTVLAAAFFGEHHTCRALSLMGANALLGGAALRVFPRSSIATSCVLQGKFFL